MDTQFRNSNLSPITGLSTWLQTNEHKQQLTIIAIAFLVGLAFLMFGPNLDANWWIIDDHEIMQFSPESKPLGFSEIIPTLLTKTEINPSSEVPRFRPIYYLFRLIETRLWQSAGPTGWYFARIVAFIFLLITSFVFFSRTVGQIPGFLLTLSVSSLNFWTDIFSRLGPSEVYCVVGIGLFIIGALLVSKNKAGAFGWILLLLSVVISVGSKETMGILLAAYFLVVYFYFRGYPRKKILPLITFGLSIGWTVWIYAVLFVRLNRSAGDVYSNPIDSSSRLQAVLAAIQQQPWIYIFILAAVGGGLIGLIVSQSARLKDLFRILMLYVFGIFALLLSQEYFYAGNIWGRYNFPVALATPLLIALIIHFGQKIEDHFGKKWAFRATSVIGGAVLLTFFIHPTTWFSMNDLSKINVNKTNFFMSKVDDIAEVLSVNPATALILYGNTPGSDYETSASYTEFLRARMVTNPIYILRDPGADYESRLSGLDLTLEKDLLRFSLNGNSDWGVDAWKDYPKKPGSCLLVTLRDDHPAPIQCETNIDGNVLIKYQGLYKRWE